MFLRMITNRIYPDNGLPYMDIPNKVSYRIDIKQYFRTMFKMKYIDSSHNQHMNPSGEPPPPLHKKY